MWIFRYEHWISAKNNAPGWKNVKCAIYHSLPCNENVRFVVYEIIGVNIERTYATGKYLV